MRGARWVGIAVVGITAIACARYPVLPRNVRESVHRDHPSCGGRHIRGLDLGGGRYQVLGCDLNVVYVCPTGPHSRWRACMPEQTAGGYAAATSPAQPVTIVVTGGVQGPQTIQSYPAQPAPQAAPPPAPAQAWAAPTAEQIEAGVGQWIDSHRAEILACTGTPAALVEVTWDATGIPAVALGGEMRGSPGEPCVAQVLSGVQLNVAGQPGSIRHVVQ
jgi:hypothetical protein